MATEHPVLALKRIHDATLVLAGGLGLAYIAIWMGALSDDVCLPLGIAGLLAGAALLVHAARRHDRSWDASDDVGEWARSIRRMACINIGLSVMLLALPDVA